jgi:hypothetical protein
MVRGWRADGHQVEIVSPNPSAAGQHLDLRSRRGRLALARVARHADRAVVRIVVGGSSLGGAPPPPSILRALRTVDEVEVHLYRDAASPASDPWLSVRPSAKCVLLAHQIPERAHRDIRETRSERVPRDETWPTSGRAAVMIEVRDRAAAQRAAGVERSAEPRSAPIRRVAPLALPTAVSNRPGASFGKRVVRRLTAWQIDPIVAQLNRMRDALVEAFEQDDP